MKIKTNFKLEMQMALLTTLLLLGGQLMSQDLTTEDSLRAIAQSGETSKAALAYKELARRHTDSLDLHLFYGDKGLEVARAIPDSQMVGNLLMNMGVASDIHGKFDQAIAYYDSAYAIFQDIEDSQEWLVSLNINYGAAYYFKGSSHLALEYWLRAYESCVKDATNENYAYLLNNIAHIYEELKKYPDAINYYEKSLSLKLERSDTVAYLTTLRNLGRLYYRSGDVTRSIQALDQCIQNYAAIDDKINVQIAQIYKAEAFLADGKLMDAEKLLAPLLAKDFANQEISTKIDGYTIAGRIQKEKRNYAKAVFYFEKGKSIIDNTDHNEGEEKILVDLATCYYHLGNLKAAYELSERSRVRISDQLNSDRLDLEQEMQVKFQTLQKEQENISLQNENRIKNLSLKRSQRSFWFIFLSLLVVIVVAISIHLNRQRVAKLNRQLQAQKKVIERTLSERETLLREIHHRVKNNLQFISSLLSLQTEHIDDPNALEALQGGQDRVQSMALIHQNLYQEDNLTGIDVIDYFQKLTQNLFDSYNINPDRIKLLLDIEEINIDVESVVPLGLIVNELVSNALKHAFPGTREGTISIWLKEQGDRLLLEVTDDGVGLDTQKRDVMESSFGYRLINALKDQLDGKLEIDGSDGTKVRLYIQEFYKAA
jgi:two-component sensor histidine kinase